MYRPGQIFYKTNELNQITDVYRILTTCNKEFYRMSVTSNDKNEIKLIEKDSVSDLIECEWHCMIHLELVKLEDGSEDLLILMYNPTNSNGFPYYINRVVNKDGQGGFIDRNMFDSAREFVDAYKDFISDVKTTIHVFEYVTYMNDSIKVIANFLMHDTIIKNWLYKFITTNKVFGLTIDYSVQDAITSFFTNINFMGRFHINFGIIKTNLDLYNKKELRPGDLYILEAILKEEILDYILVQYYYDVNLRRVLGDYILVMDRNDVLYILKFVGRNSLVGLN